MIPEWAKEESMMIGMGAVIIAVLAQEQQDLDRGQLDIVLVLGLILFYLLKALLIKRDSGLGWSMATSNIILSFLFAWAIWGRDDEISEPWFTIGTALRVILLICVAWAVVELLAARMDQPSPGTFLAVWVRHQRHRIVTLSQSRRRER